MFGCSINGLKDGGKEMTEVLRTGRRLWRKISSYFLKICICGQLFMGLFGRLVTVIFLFFLIFLARSFLLYTLCVFSDTLRF
jgi:hypothetical protein